MILKIRNLLLTSINVFYSVLEFMAISHFVTEKDLQNVVAQNCGCRKIFQVDHFVGKFIVVTVTVCFDLTSCVSFVFFKLCISFLLHDLE